MTTKLYPYQKEVLKEIDQFNGRSLCALEMGLGKTLIALTHLHDGKDSTPAVVVCPASVKYVWEYEAAHHLKMRATVLIGQTPSESNGQTTNKGSLFVINYDVLQYWLPWLKQLGLRTVIIDESHYLGNRTTKRTKSVKELCKGIPNVLALSGTPLTNRPAELWPTLNILRPDLYKSFWSFGQTHCGAKLGHWGWEFKGATQLPKLHSNLKDQLMIRRLKKDVLKGLPEKVRNVLPCDLKDRKEYDFADAEFLNWLRQFNAAKIKGAKAAHQLVKIGYLLRLSARLKLPAVVRWANKFLRETNEKLILFAVHKKMISALNRRVKCKHVIIDGSVTGRHRKDRVDQFQKDSKTRVLIGNLQAAGTGITLTAASTVAFAEMSWRPGDFIQAEDRPHRIGQTKTVFVYYLIAGGTVEETLCKIIQSKQNVLSAVMDGTPVGNLNVFDQFIKTQERRLL